MKTQIPALATMGRWLLRVEFWAPALVVALVGLVLWLSFWSGPSVNEVAAEQTAREGSGAPSETGEDPAEAADDAGSGGATAASGGKGKGKGRGGVEKEVAGGDAASLERSVRRFRAAQRRLAQRVSQQAKKRDAPVEFQVASFNVLGASHTGAGGRPGYPAAGARMAATISILRTHGIDVVGFQEFEQPQYNQFNAQAGEYATYPGMSLGNKSVRFNIAWRSSMWRLVEGRSLSIPYAGGNRIQMPVVLLESTTNGRRAWFANFHNPADTPNLGNNARWRAMAAGIEISYLSNLHAETGQPVIVTGDFNERGEIFCRFTASGVFSAAAGGSSGGGCAPPPRMQVDWIFGSGGVSFSGYAVTGTGRASDHEMVSATATLGLAG